MPEGEAQAPVSFEDVAVRFSAEEWAILQRWQKELHKEVMEENSQLLISLGQPVPTLVLPPLTEEWEAPGHRICRVSGEGACASDGGSADGEELACPDGDPEGGRLWDSEQTEEDGYPTGDGEEAQQGSLHLSALMKLVKEIPEFLFGNSNAGAEPAEAAEGEAEPGSERADAVDVTPEAPPALGLQSHLAAASVSSRGHPDSTGSSVSPGSTDGSACRSPPADEVAPENSPLRGLLSCLKEIPISRARHPGTQSPSMQGSTEPRNQEAEVKEVTMENPPTPGLTDLTGGSSSPSTPTSSWSTGSARGEVEDLRVELGLWRCSREDRRAETSPLQGLFNCLKEIMVQKAPHPHPAPCESPKGSRPGDAGQRRPESEAGSSSVGVKTEAVGEDSPRHGLEDTAGSSPCCTHPPTCLSPSSDAPAARRERPGRGAGSPSAEEATLGASPLLSLASCLQETPLSPPWASPRPARHAGADASPREPQTGVVWGWCGEDVGTGTSPLQGLENCLRDIPVTGPHGARVPASIALASPQRDTGQGRPGAGAWSSLAEEVRTEHSPLQGLENCLKDIPVPRPRHASTPLSRSSGSSSPDPRGRLEAAEQPVEPEGAVSEATAPLRGLENCLKDIPVNKPMHSCVAARYFSPRQGPGSWRACAADSSPPDGLLTCLMEISASPLSRSSAEGEQDLRGVAPWRWRREELSPENSPLQGLERCLREISVPSAPATSAVVGIQQGDAAQRTLEPGHWGWPGPGERQAGCFPGLGDCSEKEAVPRSQPLPSGAWREAEQREWEAPARGSDSRAVTAESSPLPGLTCWKEAPADRPAPSQPLASHAQGDETPQGAELRGRKLPREGLETCWSARPVSDHSRASPPLCMPAGSSLPGAAGERSPQPGLCRLHGGAGLPADALRDSSATCPKGSHGNGASCSNRLGGISGHRHPRSPGTGIKRPYTEARTDAAQTPTASCCISGADGGQKADAEGEDLPKRHCSGAVPSPRESCGRESGVPLELRVEMRTVKTVLSEKLDQLSQDLAAVCRDVSSMRRRVDRLEQDSRGWALDLAALQKGNRHLSKTIRQLESRCHALENRARRNSLRLVGLPEGAEGGDPITFLQRTLPAVLNLPTASSPLEIESARRLPGGARGDPATRPRALVFRLLRFSDKLAILRAVRKCSQPLTCGGARVALFPDACPKLYRRRVQHAAIRRLWRAAEHLPGPTAAADEQESRVTKGQ